MRVYHIESDRELDDRSTEVNKLTNCGNAWIVTDLTWWKAQGFVPVEKEPLLAGQKYGEPVLEDHRRYYPAVAKSEEEIATITNTLIAQHIDHLWESAAAYEKQFIYGAALSMLTIGVLQGKPKSLAITAWIGRLWNGHYYPQKALVTANYSGYDFSVVGPIPYSIPELSEEVFGA